MAITMTFDTRQIVNLIMSLSLEINKPPTKYV